MRSDRLGASNEERRLLTRRSPVLSPPLAMKGAPAWRFNALGLSEDKESGQKVASTSGADDGGYVATEQPKTSADFERTWKKMCRTNRDKYDYVKFCSAETLSKIFKVSEISSFHRSRPRGFEADVANLSRPRRLS